MCNNTIIRPVTKLDNGNVVVDGVEYKPIQPKPKEPSKEKKNNENDSQSHARGTD